MNLEQIKNELKDIKFYYMYNRKSTNTRLPMCFKEKADKYEDIMKNASARYYILYYYMFVKGMAQKEVSVEMNVSLGYVKVLTKRFYNYLYETLNKG